MLQLWELAADIVKVESSGRKKDEKDSDVEVAA